MAAALLYLPANRAFNSNGLAVPGAVAKLYLSGTLTPANFYSNAALSVSLGSSITANGAGRFDPAYQDESIAFRLIIEDGTGVQLDDIDPFHFGSLYGASVIGTGLTIAADRAALAGLGSSVGAVRLNESGREGDFAWDGSDLSAQVTADPLQGIYVPPSADTTGASGAWVRQNDVITVKHFGTLGDGVTDDTAAITAAFASASKVHIPAGTYIASALTVPANTEVTTDGFDTIIKQKSGTGANARLITVAGSNVSIGDISVEGQLNQAGDTTGEQNHGIFVALVPGSTDSLSNISIGNVQGTNIRGDVVYVGTDPTAYTAGHRLSGVSVGKVTGSNVFRNVVSVTGGSDISIESATGTQVGLYAFNAEGDVGNGPITGLRVGYIKGRTCGFVGPDAGTYIEAEVGHVDLDPSYTTDSTPAFGGTAYQHGAWYRNCKSLKIGRLYANGHYGQALKAVTGAIPHSVVEIGALEVPDGCLTDASLRAYVSGDSTVNLTIGAVIATVTRTSNSVFTAVSNVIVGVANVSLAPSTNYMRSCTDCITNVTNIARASGNGGTVDLGGTRCHYRGGTQLCDYFFNSSTHCTTAGVDATAASSYDNSGTGNLFGGYQGGVLRVALLSNSAVSINGSSGDVSFTGSVSGASLLVGGGTALTKIVAYAPILTPVSVAAQTVAEQTFTVAGLTTADKVVVNPPAIANATGIEGARVSAADTLAIRFSNPTAGALVPSAGTYTVLAFRS